MSTAVAVGVFDGVHRGHQSLFERARGRAAGGRAIAVSFDPHPDIVLAKEFRSVPPLTPLPERHERLARLGIELHVLPFTRELAALSPEAFVDEHLLRPFAPGWLVVGENFALGRARAGNVERLRAIGRGAGFEVEAVPLLVIGGAPVSSSRIRTALAAGEVAEAARLLGRPHELVGRVVHGESVGRSLGYPTANLRLHDEKQLPADGVYAVWVRGAAGARALPGAMSIGTRPTFGGIGRVLEVHVLDWQGDLYERDLDVAFVDRLRPQARFDSREALVAAMDADVAEVARRLASAQPPVWEGQAKVK